MSKAVPEAMELDDDVRKFPYLSVFFCMVDRAEVEILPPGRITRSNDPNVYLLFRVEEFENTLHCREVGSMQTMMERTVL
jgi:hypothetical protein